MQSIKEYHESECGKSHHSTAVSHRKVSPLKVIFKGGFRKILAYVGIGTWFINSRVMNNAWSLKILLLAKGAVIFNLGYQGGGFFAGA